MPVQIGFLIKNRMNELRISPIELAGRLGMTRMNIHSILKRKSMQVDLLEKIGNALNHDFFQHYCKVKNHELQAGWNNETAALKKQLEAAQREADEKQREIDTLHRILEALKEKG